jgi:hypothetical protein
VKTDFHLFLCAHVVITTAMREERSEKKSAIWLKGSQLIAVSITVVFGLDARDRGE